MPDAIDARVAFALAQPYHWIIQPGEGGFSASVLEFPGCYSSGATAAEAATELEDAIVTWVSGELEAGRDIPEPIDPEHSSGRLTFRIPPTLHYRAQLRAGVEGVSLNRLLSDAVSQYMGDHEPVSALAAMQRLSISAGDMGRIARWRREGKHTVEDAVGVGNYDSGPIQGEDADLIIEALETALSRLRRD